MKKKIIALILSLLLIGIASTLAISQSRGNAIANLIKAKNDHGNTQVALIINGQEITQDDYQIAIELQKANLEKLSQVNNELSTAPDTENKSKQVSKINKKIQMGSEKLALSKLIYDATIIDEAKQEGVLVSMSEAKSYANKIRQQMENNQSPQEQDFQDFISAMGEDYYWNTYAPQMYQVGLSATKLRKIVMTGNSPQENTRLWNNYLMSLAVKADITVKDNSIKVDKNEIVNYIKTYED